MVTRLIAVFVLLICAPAAAEVAGTGTVRVAIESRGPQVPMLLGNERHTGISRFEGPRRGVIAWHARLLGGLIGSPAADADGNVYFATQAGWLHVFKADGSGERRAQLSSGSHSTPAVTRGGLVIVPARDGTVTAFTTDLTPVWSTSLGKELLSSPVIDRRSGRVIVSANDVTAALDIDTGAIKFRWSAGNGRNNSSPTVAPDGNVRITNWGGFAVSLDPAGTEVWRAALGKEGFWSSPTLGPRGELYTAGDADRVVVALSPAGRELWRRPIPSGVQRFMAQRPAGGVIVPNQATVLTLDVDTGNHQVGAAVEGGRGTTTPTVSRDGVVYFGTASGHLQAVEHGRTLWSVTLPGPMEGAPIIVGPVSGRTRIVAVDISGNVICVE